MSNGDWSAEADRLSQELHGCSAEFIETADVGEIADIVGEWFTEFSVIKTEEILATLRMKRLIDRLAK
jgi:hypothetical protein